MNTNPYRVTQSFNNDISFQLDIHWEVQMFKLHISIKSCVCSLILTRKFDFFVELNNSDQNSQM